MYPDIKFKIGKEKIYAHKVVLVGASSVFKKKFEEQGEKNSENMKRPSTHTKNELSGKGKEKKFGKYEKTFHPHKK